MYLKRKLPILLAMLLSSYANASVCGTKIDELAKLAMAKNNVAGVSIAIVNKNKTEYCNYGYANKATHQKMSQYTIFGIASLTKTFTATSAAIASIKGKFDLLAPINTYIPELKQNSSLNSINGQELLAYVSGLPFKAGNTTGVITESEFLSQLVKLKPKYAPATMYLYSNAGISIVGLALERIYHQDYQSILEAQFLNKLNMQYTFIDVPHKYKHFIGMGYDENSKPAKIDELGAYASAGSLKSNAYDLSKYLGLQINGSNDKIINDALSIVHKNYYCLGENGQYHQQLAWEETPVNSVDEDYNLESAVNVRSMKTPYKLATQCVDKLHGIIEKTGNISGVSSYIAYIPDRKIGVVVLMNKTKVSDDVNLGRSILKMTR